MSGGCAVLYMSSKMSESKRPTRKKDSSNEREPPSAGGATAVMRPTILDYLKSYKPYSSKQTTSLVSIISPTCTISDLRDMVRSEQASARNIKNNTNRKSVVDALSGIWTVVSDLKSVPSSGIALYAGQCI